MTFQMLIYTKKLKTEWTTDGQLTKTIFTDTREAHSVGNWFILVLINNLASLLT